MNCDEICVQVSGVVGRAELLSSLLFLLTVSIYRRAAMAMARDSTEAHSQGTGCGVGRQGSVLE